MTAVQSLGKPVSALTREELLAEAVALKRLESGSFDDRGVKNARRDLIAFFEFAMREEKTQQRMRVAAHQRVMFSFVQHPAHAHCALIVPVEHAKSYSLMAMGLWLLCKNPSLCGMIVSDTQAQAKKPLSLMLQQIEHNPELRLVGAHMRRSRKKGDPWSDTKFTIARPPGAYIRDPSFVAVGLLSGSIPGSRIDYLLIDDVVNPENSNTPEQRAKVEKMIDDVLLPRMLKGGRIVFCNTTHHPTDAINKKRATWPTLVMGADGRVEVHNADPLWECDDLVATSAQPVTAKRQDYRLAAHEPDPKNQVPLWPERFPVERLENIRTTRYPHNPGAFNRLYMSDCHDDSVARCKRDFIKRCNDVARRVGATRLLDRYDGPNLTFTGVDLAVKVHAAADMTALFTFEYRRQDGVGVVLDVDFGRWDAETIMDKVFEKQRFFRSQVCVEDVGAQNYLLQALHVRMRDPAYRNTPKFAIESRMTSEQSKSHPEYGLESLFSEMARGYWAFPCDPETGLMPPKMQQFADDCLGYQPAQHTSDLLMASFMARWMAVDAGLVIGAPMGRGVPGAGGGISSR